MRRLLAGVALLFVMATGHAQQNETTVASGFAKGSSSYISLSGDAVAPNSIFLTVTANPSQKVEGDWRMFCEQGDEFGSKSSSFKGTAPLERKLPLPLSNPDSCDVSASVTFQDFDQTGRLKLRVYHY